MRNRNFFILVNVGVLIALALLVLTAVRTVTSTRMTWSEARAEVAADHVEQVIFDGEDAILVMKTDEGQPPKSVNVVQVPGDDTFITLLEEHGVKYGAQAQAGCGSAGDWIFPVLMIGLLWMFFSRQSGGVPPGVASFAKSSHRLVPEEGTGVTFDDVAGIDEAIEELKEIVEFLKTPEKFTALGGKIPKGVLLVGPPGTGKTLLARAVAGEAGVPFFSISGSDFVEMFVGVGAARVRDLFQKAAEHAPTIIFIDELDAIGKARGNGSPVGGHDEREQTLNQLLVEMDGFDGRKGIIIVAATNRPETLDQALMRAGRFDRQVMVDRPDLKGREAILKIHARELKLDEGVDLEAIARMTSGFAGADLANILNEGALLAARRDKKAIGNSEIEEAIERVFGGLERKSRRLSDQERRVTAYHEAGHAICAAACPGSNPVQKISIIPRGFSALGYTLQPPSEDRYLISRTEMKNELIMFYGGRAAEELVLGDFTGGASSDIRRASSLARRMVCELGMSDSLGPIDYGGETQNPFSVGGRASRDVAISDKTAQLIDQEVNQVLRAAHEQARAILAAHRDLLDQIATQLLETEVLDHEQLKAFLDQVEPDASTAVPWRTPPEDPEIA